MNTVEINGKCFEVPNGSICITGGKVFVNGQCYDDGSSENSKLINITIEGNCGPIKVDYCEKVEVKGDVNGAVDAGGAVVVHGDVKEYVDAGGSITCGNVGGDVDAGGSVKCGRVSGDIDAGGSIMNG